MDPSRAPRGPYRSAIANASNRDDDEVEGRHIVVDISPVNYNENAVYRNAVSGAPTTRWPEIDLNNPAQQEEDDKPVQLPVVNAPVQQAPLPDDYTGSNWGNSGGNYGNYCNSSNGGYVDWASGSMDVAPHDDAGKALAFYENAHPTPTLTPPARDHGDTTEFDLNAAVREAQERDETYCQERLENLRRSKAVEDQFLDMSFRNSSPAEDPCYYKLWSD